MLTHARTILFVEFAALEPSSQGLLVKLWFAATRLGYEAVMLFFVLSGFLVGGRAIEAAMQRRFDVSRYIVDRVVRIMVPLVAAIALSVAITLSLGGSVDPVVVAGNVLSVQGAFVAVLPANSPLWSLSYEVWFYVMGGAIAFMLTRRAVSAMPIACLVAAIVVLTMLKPLYAMLWFGGAAAYFYRPATCRLPAILAGLALFVAGVASFQLSLPRTGAPLGVPIGQVAGGALILAGASLLLPHLVAARWTSGALARVGGFLASFSYSLYLIHVPILGLSPIIDSAVVDMRAVAIYVAMVAAAMAAAFLFSRLFETTGPSIKAAIARYRQGVVSTRPAARAR